MRRSVLMCVLMISLLLSGCGGGGNETPMEKGLAVRGQYLSADGCVGRVKVSADYGQRTYSYVLDVAVTGQETRLTVLEPAEIAGITARLQAGESTLSYDGAVLETGPLSEDGLTPMSAVTALLEAVRSGFIDSCGWEGENLYILCRDPEEQPGRGRQIALWFDGASGRLLQGEVSANGWRVLTCEFEEFALT